MFGWETALTLAAPFVLVAASPQPYIEAKGFGAAGAARIISAQRAEPATVRVSYTDRDGRQVVLVTHPYFADSFELPEYKATAFYAIPGERNPLFRVSVGADTGRNYSVLDIYVAELEGKVAQVPVYEVDDYSADAKPVLPEQHFAHPLRTLHFKRELDRVGGGSVQGFAQYFVRLSDGRPAILQTTWLLEDKSLDTSQHAKPQPEPNVAGTCYRLYRQASTTFFAVCHGKTAPGLRRPL